MKKYSDELASITKDLMFAEPHYGLFLMMLNKHWTTDVPTAAVGLNGINYELYINPNYWDSLDRDRKSGIIKHELGHIGFHHLTEFASLVDRKTAGLAFDLEVNQYLNEKELHPTWLTLDKFPELNLGLRKGSKYYYDELMKAKNNKSSHGLNSLLEQLESQPYGECDLNGEKVITGEHKDLSTELSPVMKKVVENQVNRMIEEVLSQTKHIGKTPGFFEEIFKRLPVIVPPKFDWKGYFRRFVVGNGDVYTKKTRRKESLRFEGSAGLRVKRKCNPLIALDTSGSVSTEELKEFFNEIHHMHKTGINITIIQCDTTIKSIEKYKPNMETKIVGRGGTNFFPVITYYNENLHKYTSLIYLTDGEASTPPPAKGKMLWVFSSKSSINNDLIGHKIKLN